MAAPNPVMTQRLVAIASAAAAAGHGGKGEIYERGAAELGISLPTLHRKLKEVKFPEPRKRRSDAGQVELGRDEALLISAYLIEATRRNGKRLPSIQTAVDALRSNGFIQAERVDRKTGEVIPLSVSAISRSLYTYGLHPDQLSRPTPKQEMQSLHPNHIWQIDPSLCVLYYLPKQQGLQCMKREVFYKNKIDAIAKITHERVWRYVFTDHTSGAFYVEYVLGAESGHNLSHCFINAMQKRHAEDPFHGRPKTVMVDPGSANTGAVFKNLCAALSIEVLVNEPGKPWAKGQVEKTNDIVERHFEQGLRFVRVDSLDDLNFHCHRWMRKHNGFSNHSRTNRTRYAVWQLIKPDQLITVPEPEFLRELAVTRPEERLVNPFLRVSYRGQEWDVSEVPGVAIGEKLLITRNAFRPESAQAVIFDADGRQSFFLIETVQRNEFGFDISSPVIGESYKRHKVSAAENARSEIETVLMGTDDADKIKKMRKDKALPFGGELDPFKPVTDIVHPTYMPKRGTELPLQKPMLEAAPLTVVEVAKRLKPELGDIWNAEAYAWVQKNYPEGVREDDLPTIESSIRSMSVRTANLRVVGGA